MKKGYTLVELLGVIIIIALVSMLVFPSLINFIKGTNDTQDELTRKLIINQAELFVKDNPENFKSVYENTYCISIETLIENNYLSGKFELDGEDITSIKSVKATYTNKFNYEIVNSDNCIEIVEGEVPSNIQIVEYIESNGTQYIDTGIKPDSNTDIDIIYKSLDYSPSQYIAGSRDGDKATIEYAINGSYTRSDWDIRLGGVATYSNIARTDDKIETIISMTNGTGTWILKNLDKDTSNTINFSAANINSTANLFLFGYNSISSNIHTNLRLYGCKIYDGETLVRDFVPVLDPKRVPCLYDKVSKEYFYNSGEGYFEYEYDAGDIKLPIEYQKVEYIESNGTQYIDTGFTPNQDTRVVVDFQYIANTNAFLFGARIDSRTAGYAVNISSGNCVTSYGNTGNIIYGKYDGLRHTIDKNKNVFYLDGVEKITSPVQNFEAPGALEIFASYNNGSEGYLPSNARIYSFKIYDNDLLVRYFIPCYRKTDNVGGMYDVVNKVFYTSSVGAPFVIGQNVEE